MGGRFGKREDRLLPPDLQIRQENVDTEIAITEPEVDVRVHGDPLSIKTITGRKLEV